MNHKKRIIGFSFVSLLALFVWVVNCSNNFAFLHPGEFSLNPDGGFVCGTDSGTQNCVDNSGTGEPDQTADGQPFTPDVPSGSGTSSHTTVDESPVPESGSEGGVCGVDCPNHFDVDSFRPSCSSTLSKQCYHVHQYDKLAPHYAVTDFLADTKFQFEPAISSCSSNLKFHFRHANKVSGKIELVVGGHRHYLSTATTKTFANLIGGNEGDWVTGASGAVTKFRLQPDNLNVLVGTQPGMVQKTPPKRHCAFEIQVFCGSSKVWEFATYEHISGDRGADCTD